MPRQYCLPNGLDGRPIRLLLDPKVAEMNKRRAPLSVPTTLLAIGCGATLFIAQPIPYLLQHRLSQILSPTEPGTYGAMHTNEVLADLPYWTDLWWIAGVALFTLVLVLHRVIHTLGRPSKVFLLGGAALLAYVLPPLVEAGFVSDGTTASTELVNFVLLQAFFYGNGWIALVLALVYGLVISRPQTDGPSLNGDDHLHGRYNSKRR